MRWRKKDLLALSVLILVAVGAIAWYVMTRGTALHLYDANRTRLAETAQEAYCAGQVFWTSQGRGGDTTQCRQSEQDASAEYDLTVVLPEFCTAVIANGWVGPLTECVDILTAGRLWPTLDGRLTDNFTNKYPWPGGTFPGIDDNDGGRVPDRDPIIRGEEG